MSFQTFDQTKCGGQLLATIDLNKFLQAVATWFKSGECVAEFQAFVRATANPTQVVTQGLTPLFNNRPQGPNAQLPAVKQYLYQQGDQYFTNTILTTGNQRLASEAQTRKTYWTTGLGKGEFPDFFEYCAQGLTKQEHLSTPRQAQGYIDLLQEISRPYLAETDHNKYNQNHKQAVKVSNSAPAALNAVTQGQLKNDDGTLNANAGPWKTFLESVNYWTTELERRKVREPLVTQLANAANGDGAKIFRLVSGGEKEFIASKGKLAQGPGSYERHKWFFYSGGAPGVGHEWKVEVSLAPTLLNFMLENAIECGEEKADSKQAFIKKSNEHDCIGIHEDVLEALHQKLAGFTITNNKNSSVKSLKVKVNP